MVKERGRDVDVFVRVERSGYLLAVKFDVDVRGRGGLVNAVNDAVSVSINPMLMVRNFVGVGRFG